MRRFFLNRIVDSSGVSGTGPVAEGICFSNGKCVLCWRTDTTSIGIYDDVERLMKVHGHGGDTELVWIDAYMEAQI